MDSQPEVVRAAGAATPLSIWCSTLRRTVETVQELKGFESAVQWRALTEIQVGICDGMTYQEIEKKYPDEFKGTCSAGQGRAQPKYMYACLN
jgi:6-phosphofructo-2-kinase/fructose-2,6-biphosphatase 2